MALCAALFAAMGSVPAGAQVFRPSEDIVADATSGAALHGFDPVGYFIAGRAVPGSPRFQAGFAGKVWYFASRANQAAFEANPDAYLPAFGGHDPVAVASGLAVTGSPAIHAVHAGRIFLFRRAENRTIFLAKPELLAEAERHWGEVRRQLSP
jgi:YHS domain-containing protein